MKFGLKQLYNKTPRFMVRLGLAFQAATSAGIGWQVFLNPHSKIAASVAVIGLIGVFLVAFFGDNNVDNDSK